METTWGRKKAAKVIGKIEINVAATETVLGHLEKAVTRKDGKEIRLKALSNAKKVLEKLKLLNLFTGLVPALQERYDKVERKLKKQNKKKDS